VGLRLESGKEGVFDVTWDWALLPCKLVESCEQPNLVKLGRRPRLGRSSGQRWISACPTNRGHRQGRYGF
jgi:hypothetical protein